MFKLFLKSNLEDYKYLLILSPIINFVLFTILFINVQFIPGDDKGIGIFIIKDSISFDRFLLSQVILL